MEINHKTIKIKLKVNFIGDVKWASTLGKLESKVISMYIVPVNIKYKNNGKQITTCAMLDNCSQGSFVHEGVLIQLDVKGTKIPLSLKILHREKSENTSATAAMQVKDTNGDGNWLRMQRLYAKKDLPVDKEDIATPEKITEWNISNQ